MRVSELTNLKLVNVDLGSDLIKITRKGNKEQYLREKAEIQQQLIHAPAEDSSGGLERLAAFLANVAQAWEEANQEQRNKLARCLFQEVWVKDKQVIAVRPQPELAPFFKLNYEETVNKILNNRPRGDLNP